MAVAHREILAAMPTSELPGEGVVRLDGLHVVEEREDAIRQTAEQLVPEFHRGWLNSTRGTSGSLSRTGCTRASLEGSVGPMHSMQRALY